MRLIEDTQMSSSYGQCKKCDFIFATKLPSLDAEKKQYSHHQNSLENEGYVQMFEHFITQTLLPHADKNRALLEFGSGPTPVLSVLLDRHGFDVQIYDPANDNWLAGTATPNQTQYKMFGASGTIIGDTIYYNGGVTSGFSFNATSYLRRGIIDANDPAIITWSLEQDNPGGNGYRMAAAKYQNRCFWIGGSGTAYNYNGIAYNGSGGVEPHTRILAYQKDWNIWFEGLGAPFGIMDLRGIAQITPTSWIICGGMETGQQVTNRAFLLEFDPIAGGIGEKTEQKLSIYPNPAQNMVQLSYLVSSPAEVSWQIYDITGRVVYHQENGLTSHGVKTDILSTESLNNGIYFIKLTIGNNSYSQKLVISK